MKIILITGATGFVGSNLVKYLEAQYTIWSVGRISQKNTFVKEFTWEQLDNIPYDQIDTIIHLAGKAHDTKGTSEANLYFQVNTDLTKRIFDKYISSQCKRFIYFSSVKAAADTVEEGALTEDVIPKPIGPYGESKIKAENYILRTDYISNKKVYILRPCMIHGPGNKGNLNLLYKIIEKGIPYPLGKFNNLRSFTSIRNLSFVVKKLLTRDDIESGIYNIADDYPLSTNQLIMSISEVLGKKDRIWKIPKRIISCIAKVGNILHLPLNSNTLTKLTENYIVSNDKIKKAIGVNKLPTEAIIGIKQTIKSFIK